MKHFGLLAAASVAGLMALLPLPARAAVCASGVYRAGCAGPRGAVVVRKPPVYHRRVGPVACANGVYRAGCVGPNGAAVVRKQY